MTRPIKRDQELRNLAGNEKGGGQLEDRRAARRNARLSKGWVAAPDKMGLEKMHLKDPLIDELLRKSRQKEEEECLSEAPVEAASQDPNVREPTIYVDRPSKKAVRAKRKSRVRARASKLDQDGQDSTQYGHKSKQGSDDSENNQKESKQGSEDSEQDQQTSEQGSHVLEKAQQDLKRRSQDSEQDQQSLHDQTKNTKGLSDGSLDLENNEQGLHDFENDQQASGKSLHDPEKNSKDSSQGSHDLEKDKLSSEQGLHNSETQEQNSKQGSYDSEPDHKDSDGVSQQGLDHEDLSHGQNPASEDFVKVENDDCIKEDSKEVKQSRSPENEKARKEELRKGTSDLGDNDISQSNGSSPEGEDSENDDLEKQKAELSSEEAVDLAWSVGQLFGQLKLLIEEHKQDIHEQREIAADIEYVVQCLEKSMQYCQIIWKIDNFKEKYEKAKSGVTPLIYSPIFKSHPYGYTMALSLCPNGDGKGKGKYLSLFFCLVQGTHDALLDWPFCHNIQFSVEVPLLHDAFHVQEEPTTQMTKEEERSEQNEDNDSMYYKLNKQTSSDEQEGSNKDNKDKRKDEEEKEQKPKEKEPNGEMNKVEGNTKKKGENQEKTIKASDSASRCSDQEGPGDSSSVIDGQDVSVAETKNLGSRAENEQKSYVCNDTDADTANEKRSKESSMTAEKLSPTRSQPASVVAPHIVKFTPRIRTEDDKILQYLKRPDKLRNPSLGLPRFMPLDKLWSGGYIQGNCLFIKTKICLDKLKLLDFNERIKLDDLN